ncbi:MAG: PIN domain-containing protein [Sphingorhabdus sp.]
MLDTSVAIPLRESEGVTLGRVAELSDNLMISAVTRVELENGVYRDPDLAEHRRALLDIMLDSLHVMPFDDDCAAEFGRIVAGLGWSRTTTIDRMIAATAIVSDATLITMNGKDFKNIPGLKLVIWETPEPE